jgi:hypothetical protein
MVRLSIFLLRFSPLGRPPKEKDSANKKNRASLLENLRGWLGLGSGLNFDSNAYGHRGAGPDGEAGRR